MSEPSTIDDDLRALGGLARERLQARPAAWEAVVRGQREADEVARERIEAGDEPQAAEHAAEIFRPLDDAEQDALVDELLAGRSWESAGASETVAEASPPEPAANEAPRAWWSVVLATAAAVVLTWFLWPGDRPAPIHGAPALPVYGLTHDGGLTELRSDPASAAAAPHYRMDTEFAWDLRPAVAVQEAVAVRGFAIDQGASRALPLEGLVKTSPTGSARVAGTIAALGLPAGAWTIVLVIGRPDALPAEPPADESAASDGAWRAERLPIVIED